MMYNTDIIIHDFDVHYWLVVTNPLIIARKDFRFL